MPARPTPAVVLLCCLLSGLLSACGWLKDATTITVDTDWVTIEINTDSLQLFPSGSTVPAVACSASNNTCATLEQEITCEVSGYNCSLRCAAAGQCELLVDVSQSVPIDLSSVVSSRTTASLLGEVKLDRFLYQAAPNTLSVAMPRSGIYVGPSVAQSPADTGVVLLAELEPIPAGQERSGELAVDSAGQSALSQFVRDYRTPFGFISSMRFVAAAGDGVPTGAIRLRLKAVFKAGLL